MPKRTHQVAGALTAGGLKLLGVLPVKMASDLMAFVAGQFGRYFIKHGVIRKNLRAAFPDLDQSTLNALAKKVAANFGRYLAEVAHISTFAAGKRGTKVSVTGSLDHTFGQPGEQSGQAVYVTAHLGNWELTPIALPQSSRMLVIYSLIGNSVIDGLLLSQRRKTGSKYVEKSDALKACIKAMKGGDSVGLLVDQRVERGIKVTFLGRTSIFTDLPARLAMKFNCPIIPIEAIRVNPRHTQVVFHPPIWPNEDRSKQAVWELTQKMATVIEDGIRKRPGEWYCHKRRWKRRDLADQASDPQADRGDVLKAEMS